MENEIENKIASLQERLVGDMMEDMDLQEEIFNLRRQLNELKHPTVKPDNSDFECVGCGS